MKNDERKKKHKYLSLNQDSKNRPKKSKYKMQKNRIKNENKIKMAILQ